jgi:MFS family permease
MANPEARDDPRASMDGMTNRDPTRRAGREATRAVAAAGRVIRGQIVQHVGGPARARVIALLGAVLALSTADAATIGAIAPQLRQDLHINLTEIGLLSTVALLVGALFVIPVGMLVDRVRRIPLLAASVVLWSIASLASAFAGSYSTLLLTRLALGAVSATAGPAVASLTGDYFPASERGRVYSYILAGEVGGTAAGFIVSGIAASIISWRAAFVLMSIPGFFLARSLWRTVPEPLRGGQSHLEPGVMDLHEALAAVRSREAEPYPPEPGDAVQDELAQAAVRRRGVIPDQKLVLREDPMKMRLGRAVRYILSIPSNVMLIFGSSLGYFFFAGLQVFAVLFVEGHYHVHQATAELVLVLLVIGALIGTLISGWLSDLLVRRGFVEARVLIPAACYISATALLIPGILASHLGGAIWFDVAGAALLSAANPPLDAARLDIVPARLWGRAESLRSFLRSLAQAFAPLIFGGVADLIVHFTPQQKFIGPHSGSVSARAGTGLEFSFLIMLISLAAAGVFLARARQRYPVDVATAAAARR